MNKIKIITGATLFIFFIVTASILTAGLINKNKNQNSLNDAVPKNNQSTLESTNQTNPTSNKLTSNEVAKHNKASDCWMTISNNVYDFTSFIPQHPGGLIMFPFCGKEATIAFQTMGGRGRAHSQRAVNLMKSYLVGTLE